MLLGFKTALKLNARQRVLLAKHCGVARHAWNWSLWLTKNILDHNRANPNEKLKFPTAIDLHKLLVTMVKSESLVLRVQQIYTTTGINGIARGMETLFQKDRRSAEV